ncbi:MAG: hypothetical protein IKK57_08340 [Clostridia bacterium]|nr:hypothetical protein [Clostridia bacterium]
MPNAIFLRDSYFLLPDGFPTFDAFLADLNARELPATYPLVPLLENNRIRCGALLRGQCMAPVFLSDVPDIAVPVTIRAVGEICPAAVERIPMEEYDARLRQVVRRICPGCGGYGDIDDTPASLQGHHREVSLDGLCFFRWEGAEPPLPLAYSLRTLADGFQTDGLWSRPLTEVRHAIADCTGLAIPRARRDEDLDGAHLLQLHLAQGNLLAPFVLSAADAVVSHHTHGAYRLLPADEPGFTPNALLLPENRAALQDACVCCGCSVAELTWDGQDAGRIAESLERMSRTDSIHILRMESHRAILLMLDVAAALQALRYRTPLMARHGAVCTLHGAQDVRRCTIAYDMPCETIN